ncbi:MAG: hypothetical protein M3Q45_03595, partial [Chloroflexota bacterium]|nr:hypothetical protein [Chloroflexota bacterium]
YFPGWQVRLDGETVLTTYPSTNLGLLTVDLPAGSHRLTLRWTGTPLQQGAGVAGWAALALASVVGWRQRGRRWLVIVPLALLIFGVAANRWSGPLMPIQPPDQPIVTDAVRLLGYRWEQSDPAHLWVYPYWYVTATPSSHWRARWQIQDATGKVQAEIITRPYFNAVPASNWPPGTLVDDVHQLPIPPGLAAGTYQIALRIGETEAELARAALVVGKITLARAAPRQPLPAQPLNAIFGDAIRLEGYAATVQGKPITTTHAVPYIVQSGDYLQQTLFWRATGAIEKNYHGFIHLADTHGRAIAYDEHVPGPLFRPPALWDAYYLQPDVYLLRIPPHTPSGLYWPAVRLYDSENQGLLPVTLPGEGETLDYFSLPPLKVIQQAARLPQQRQFARLGTTATLLGYDLDAPTPLHAGDALTATLYYRSETATATDYTRFLHLHNVELGMAAQLDSLPQNGVNPTWTWLPGETIVDPVQLTVAANAVPGVYTLYVGFYDANANGARLPVQDEGGNRVLDDRMPLTEIIIQP